VRFCFGDFRLDADTHELSRGGQRLNVQPKVFNLLLHLVTHHQRSVSNEELLQVLWPGETVSPASITSAVRAARRLLGDAGDSQTVIRTVRGHGYRFVHPLQEPGATVQTESPPTSAPAGTIAIVETPFVGRETVFAALEQALTRMRLGHGRSLLLIGGPGIGKSCTLHALAARARSAGARVWFGGCMEGDGAPAFWPLIQLVREAADDLGVDALRALMALGAADIAQAIPELRHWLADLADAPAISSTSARFRFFDSFAAFLRRAAAQRPLVLLFDDLQHADESTVRLLAFVAQQLERAPVLIVGATRPPEQRALTAELLRDLSRPASSVCIDLSGFSESELAHYLALRTGRTASAQQIAELLDLTSGNPLYLQQLVDCGYLQQGPLPPHEREPLLATPRARGVRAAIERQLETVSAPCRLLLQVAAVLGREFSLGLLLEVSGPPSSSEHGERVLAGLAEARISGLLCTSELPGQHRFRHALIREALYEQLPLQRRLQLHQKAGLALEARGASSNAVLLAQMADHFMHAAPVEGNDRALRYALRAAQDATARLAYEEAAAHVDRALQVLELGAPDAQRRLELLLAKGEALASATLRTKARSVLLEAAELARDLGSNEGVLRAVAQLARPLESGAADATYVAWLREGLALLAPTDARRPELEALLAKSLSYTGRAEESTRLAFAALAGARSLHEGEQRAEALFACHEALAAPKHLQTRMQISDELVSLARRLQQPTKMLRATTTQIWNALERGDMTTVDLASNMLEALAIGVREPFFGCCAKIYRAMRATVRGKLGAAEQLASEALEVGLLVGEEFAQHAHAIQMSTILMFRGRLAEAEEMVRGISARFPALGGWRAALATLHAYQGHRRHARSVLHELLADDLRLVRSEPHLLGALAPTAQLCVRVGDAKLAAPLYEALLPYQDLCGTVAFGQATHGPLARHLGLLALQMGDIPRATDHLQKAIARAERMQSPAFTSLSCAAYADALIATNTKGSLAEARELLARASHLAESLQLGGVSALCTFVASNLDSGDAARR
jgi:DNA-binding winged helix-turn-helix (wHTH) protein